MAAKTKEKENKVFISRFAFEELKKLYEKQKAEIHYYRNAMKYYQEQATQIVF